ncbi:MAG: CehA/McbA family metallohydrolase [Pirellulaceae bacterium]
MQRRSLFFLFVLVASQTASAVEFQGRVVDRDSRAVLAARVYIEKQGVQAGEPRWYFAKATSLSGSAIAYREQWVPQPLSVEKHTTVSAHPFVAELPAGDYRIRVERGKEYIPAEFSVSIGSNKISKDLPIVRFVNLAAQGWYSGETHVHRRPHELPNVQLAEDLNVTFPVTFWTINSNKAPHLSPSPLRRQGPSPHGDRKDLGADVIFIDRTHVMFPRNTEYEVFNIDQQRHTLGAVFLLNHKSIFTEKMPPVAKIAEKAHAEGALLDLDKHSWPWSMMLVPVAKVDLFELSNNSLWRTEFGFRRSAVPTARQWNVESDAGGMTEYGWIQFGLQNYYTLLNCGFDLKPTAGTASGVHPVPLGFSRVYVHQPKGFTPEGWINGLKQGRSFVTTGPMLLATLDGLLPGETLRRSSNKVKEVSLAGEVTYHKKVDRVEVVGTGFSEVIPVQWRRTATGAWKGTFQWARTFDRTRFVAVRCYQFDKNRRVRFAHTAPWYVRVDDQSIRPFDWEVDYLIQRIETEITRNQQVLPPAAMAEYQQALQIYKEIRSRAISE